MLLVSSELAHYSLFISHTIRTKFIYIKACSIKSSAKHFAERHKEKEGMFYTDCYSDSQGDNNEKQSLRIEYHEHRKIRNKEEIAAELFLKPRLSLPKKKVKGKGKEISYVTTKNGKGIGKFFRWDLRTKMFLGEGGEAARQKEHPCSVGDHRGKKSGLVSSQPTKDLDNLGTAVWVFFVSLDFTTCKNAKQKVGLWGIRIWMRETSERKGLKELWKEVNKSRIWPQICWSSLVRYKYTSAL